MKNVNWDTVQDDIRQPIPGGYIAKITKVEDVESKEYLRIEWEFLEGEFKGVNQETFDSFGYWPLAFIKSYKEKALRFFKGFKTCVEMSNRNFVFKNDPQSLVGKYVGVVLGEEEYWSDKHGEIRKRLYVESVRSGKAIRDGDFKVPELKKYVPKGSGYSAPASGSVPASDFALLDDDDGDLPF